MRYGSLYIDDIEKTKSRILHNPIQNKPAYNLTNHDISGSSPSSVQPFKRIKPSNPLEPVYKLQSHVIPEIKQPRYLRNSMEIKDIDGTAPLSNIQKMSRFETRTNNLSTQDIPGAVPRSHLRLRNLGPYDVQQQHKSQMRVGPMDKNMMYSNIDYSDLNQRSFISRRQVNPLNPQYQMPGKNNQSQDLGNIPFNTPNTMKFHQRKNEMYRSMDLKTWDIKGAQPRQNTLDANFISHDRRNQVRNIMNVTDIDGTSPNKTYDSLRIKSRHLNPLAPEYTMPGHKLMNEYGELNQVSTPMQAHSSLPLIKMNPQSRTQVQKQLAIRIENQSAEPKMHQYHQRHQSSSLAQQLQTLPMGMDSRSKASLAPLNYNNNSSSPFADIHHSTESLASLDRANDMGNSGGMLNQNGYQFVQNSQNSGADLHQRIAEIRNAEKQRASQGQSQDFQIRIHDILPVEVAHDNGRGYQRQPYEGNNKMMPQQAPAPKTHQNLLFKFA